MKTYILEGSGLHFDTARTNVQQLEEFDIDDLAWKMKGDALHLWETLGEALLTHKEQGMGTADIDNQSGKDGKDEGTNRQKKVVILGILVQNTNQKVNYLQCMLGIVMQSAHTPQKVVETLTQMAPEEGRMGKMYRDLLELHPEGGRASTSHRLQYNTWKILSDLVEHGPAYFQQFKGMVGELEFIEGIPVSITGILAQAGIHNPKDKDYLDMLDISDYIMLFHGDLGTAEHYVATNALERVHQKPSSQCDMQLENALIINKYMLLYEELMHVMNISDIGLEGVEGVEFCSQKVKDGMGDEEERSRCNSDDELIQIMMSNSVDRLFRMDRKASDDGTGNPIYLLSAQLEVNEGQSSVSYCTTKKPVSRELKRDIVVQYESKNESCVSLPSAKLLKEVGRTEGHLLLPEKGHLLQSGPEDGAGGGKEESIGFFNWDDRNDHIRPFKPYHRLETTKECPPRCHADKEKLLSQMDQLGGGGQRGNVPGGFRMEAGRNACKVHIAILLGKRSE
ncbi:hypothetical protein EDC04DRAFT_2601500 [Pisolithus marmoratus]|nr:hypothetical protein EDC04DRAFT_2601500 [Pisolithus marmoratus]